MTTWNLINFPDANSSIIELVQFLHLGGMFFIMVIMVLNFYIIFVVLVNKFSCFFIQERQGMEVIWTVAPMFILFFIAFPRLKLLYFIEESFVSEMTIKVIGHQWYWSYEYPLLGVRFDRFIIPLGDLTRSEFRLLETDVRAVVPYGVYSRMLVRSEDVIHAWSVPSLGVKVDAVPGRLNQVNVFSKRPGVFYGQCSEICGANHRFMPIKVEVVDVNYFVKWFRVLLDSLILKALVS